MTVVQNPWYVECTNTKQGLLWAATISAGLNDDTNYKAAQIVSVIILLNCLNTGGEGLYLSYIYI
jgi:hypothetical protein